ncbi:MAG: type II/IV secretion system protein, partial [Burkholderiales bacterium]|nr:type II/IV secretion system protein [Burkholderiales bacterium]
MNAQAAAPSTASPPVLPAASDLRAASGLPTYEHRLSLGELLDALAADGHVEGAAAEKLKAEWRLKKAGPHPLVVIADQKWKSPLAGKVMSADWLAEWLAAKSGLRFLHIDPLKIDFSRVGETMSITYAQRFSMLPVERTTRELVVATAEPFLTEWVKELEPILRLSIRRVVANPADIARYSTEFFSLARSIKGANKDGNFEAGINNFEQLVELGKTGRTIDANEQHVVRVVDWLLQYAYAQRASDIHLEPRREQGVVRFRIDGVLHQVYQVPPSVFAAITSRIKILGRMDVAEKRRPQDGRLKTRTADGAEVELRLSTLPTAFGEKVVMRIFDPEVLVRDFGELGFSDADRERWSTMTGRPHGIILVTGPTGSGKTTTLYSTLKHLATPEVNVCTIEDPIEMVEASFNQMQVQSAIDLSFAEGLRALMRQDPDIIMVGEIRDLETAEMAIQAALTGHLVLSTLHTNDAPSAITRLLDLGVPSYLINATVLGIMAQRLVRTLCPACKMPSNLRHEKLWDELVDPFTSEAPARVYRAVGCSECRNTGYIGRIGIYEVLMLSSEVKRLIHAETDIAKVREQAYKEGMKPLRVSGALKIAAGATTFDEVMRVAPPSGADS